MSRVRLVDHGDHVTLEPIPDDVLAATIGMFAGPGPSSDELRAGERIADAEREERQFAGLRRLPLVAVLLAEPAASAVAALLSESGGDAAVSAINAAEVVNAVARSQHADAGDVSSTIELWIEGGLSVVPVDWGQASVPQRSGLRHYHRSRMPLSLADCAAIALAEQLDATLVTSAPYDAAPGPQR